MPYSSDDDIPIAQRAIAEAPPAPRLVVRTEPAEAPAEPPKRKADASYDSDEDIPLAQRRRKLKRTTKPAKAPADDDVVCTGRTGAIALCDYAHPREYCAAVPFTAGQEHEHCPNCYCYVCDAPAGDCTEWREHCKASHKSAEWRLCREQRKAQQIDRQSAPPAAAQRNDAPSAGRTSAATTRGSAPERRRPVELVDLTSDGDEDAAEPSHPPSRPRTTSQGPATPDPVLSSTPRTTRSRDAVDLEEVVTMQMRKVELGTFDCGARQVAFTEKAIRFYTDEAPRFQPKGYPEEIELEMIALSRIQIDKQRGLMCVTGWFGYDVPEHYSCYAVEGSPKSRALFHFDTSEGDGVWSGSDRDKRVKSLMRLSPDIRNKIHFNPTEQVLIYPEETAKDAVTLTEEDCDRLDEKQILNDSLVDYELKRIQERLRAKPGGEAKLARCHFFNSFFYKRLLKSLQAPIREGFKHVEQWTKHIDLFNKDFIFVPIAESDHWTLAVICNPGALVPDEAAGGSSALAAVEEEGDSDVEDEACDEVVAELELALCYQPEGSDTDASENEEEEAAAAAHAEDGWHSVGGPQSSSLRRLVKGGDGGDGDEDDEADRRGPPEACLLYLDSLDGEKEPALDLLRAYLHQEHHARRRKREAAAPSSPSLGEGSRLQEEYDEAAAEEKCFTKESLPTTNVKVRAQHNHSDCGLYMLRYIELLSEHRTPSSARWKAATTKRQREYNELKFSDVSIDEKRSAMSIEIRRLGEEQRQLQEVIRASREQHAREDV